MPKYHKNQKKSSWLTLGLFIFAVAAAGAIYLSVVVSRSQKMTGENTSAYGGGAGLCFTKNCYSFEDGILPSLPKTNIDYLVGWTVNYSNVGWSTPVSPGWGENKGTIRIVKTPANVPTNPSSTSLELIGHHVNGTTSSLRACKQVENNWPSGKNYKIEVPVFLPSGYNLTEGSLAEVRVRSKASRNTTKVLEAFVFTPNSSLTNQWQTLSGTFKPTKSGAKILDFCLIANNNQVVIFGKAALYETSPIGQWEQISNSTLYDYGTGTIGGLPASWDIVGGSSPSWGGNTGTDLGSTAIQDKIVRPGRSVGSKAVEIVSYNPAPQAKNSLYQACSRQPFHLERGRDYNVSAHVYIPENSANNSASLLIQGVQTFKTPPYLLLNKPQTKGEWQFISGNFHIDKNVTPTSPADRYQLCLQTSNNGIAIFDDVAVTEVSEWP